MSSENADFLYKKTIVSEMDIQDVTKIQHDEYDDECDDECDDDMWWRID